MPPKATLVKLKLGDTLIWEEGEVLSRGERERRVRTAIDRNRGQRGAPPAQQYEYDGGPPCRSRKPS
jgi:hypothetical protein